MPPFVGCPLPIDAGSDGGGKGEAWEDYRVSENRRLRPKSCVVVG